MKPAASSPHLLAPSPRHPPSTPRARFLRRLALTLVLAVSLAPARGTQEPPSPADPATAPSPSTRTDTQTEAHTVLRRLLRESPSYRVYTGEPISLSLKDADLEEVLRSFARLTDVNLILDPEVKGKVTLELHDVPWDHALAVILKTHSLAAELDGRVWTIQPPRKLIQP